MVRFRRERYGRVKPDDCGVWDWKIGLLVEYHTWEKIASILCEGKVIRVHASEVQKAGKKYWSQ